MKSNIPINFTNQSTGAVSFLWEFGDAQVSSDLNPTHSYSTGSNYTVKLTAYSDKGCQNISNKSVAVITGLADLNRIATILTYPNPFNTHFFLSVQNEKSTLVSVRVLDITGQVMYETEGGQEQQSTRFEIPTVRLSPGVYIVQVKVDNEILTQKVFKIQ